MTAREQGWHWFGGDPVYVTAVEGGVASFQRPVVSAQGAHLSSFTPDDAPAELFEPVEQRSKVAAYFGWVERPYKVWRKAKTQLLQGVVFVRQPAYSFPRTRIESTAVGERPRVYQLVTFAADAQAAGMIVGNGPGVDMGSFLDEPYHYLRILESYFWPAAEEALREADVDFSVYRLAEVAGDED